jgi:hypothetical protein
MGQWNNFIFPVPWKKTVVFFLDKEATNGDIFFDIAVEEGNSILPV